ncbi:MAG: 3-hydroxyacyl-CoA dehydrogenase family protein [Deltaproteobacteria bacterium]|nr:3-hydroxyacyl-CoA dehydrogenase family protein [Deltaproteobacteria bacterium]
MPEISNITIIGAGLMGHGISQIFASRGYPVTLMDLNHDLLSSALKNIRSNLAVMADNNIGTHSEIESVISRIKTTTDMVEAIVKADFVVEAVSENLDLKQKVFRELDSLSRHDTILATNTSVISITEIASKSKFRERIVGTHFWNPPYLIPLVEVVRGDNTSDETMDKAFSLLKSVGKHPVRVNRDVPGFVANRLQHALWREAISIVEKGIADAATVDECVKYGFGLRLPVLAPMENADMVGTDLTFAIHDYILKHLENSPAPSPLLKKMVEEGNLGFKSGRGFQEWPSEKAEESRKRLQKYLLGVIKEGDQL